jgi:hypothetical protein
LIVSVPVASAVVVHDAVCDDTATAEHPVMAVLPASNATVPVGVGGPAGLTVTVKITGWPAVDGFMLETMVVVDAALVTTSDSVVLVLVR